MIEESPSVLARVSVVVPVYHGEHTLPSLVEEIVPFTLPGTTPRGRPFQITEVILVHDGASDNSDLVMQELAARYPFLKLVWLSRNFGQHAALIAGMAKSGADWVATIDEDGQHDPADVAKMLDEAIDQRVSLVYAKPTNPPPHGRLRNLCSDLTKWLSGSILTPHRLRWFHSYRLIRGDISRALSESCSTLVYLDVALHWMVGKAAVCPLKMRPEVGRKSGHTYRSLLSHFWRLVLASGTGPLRLVGFMGVCSLALSGVLVPYALWSKYVWKVQVPGWTSLMIVLSVFLGAILFSQALIAEYLGIAVTMAMGKPLYVIIPDPLRKWTPRAQGADASVIPSTDTVSR
jgi:undecaprenyl-phosphate 4-deoxy-4-formamido-L-arabinose transferase